MRALGLIRIETVFEHFDKRILFKVETTAQTRVWRNPRIDYRRPVFEHLKIVWENLFRVQPMAQPRIRLNPRVN